MFEDLALKVRDVSLRRTGAGNDPIRGRRRKCGFHLALCLGPRREDSRGSGGMRSRRLILLSPKKLQYFPTRVWC